MGGLQTYETLGALQVFYFFDHLLCSKKYLKVEIV
jgi:hypothetical protein